MHIPDAHSPSHVLTLGLLLNFLVFVANENFIKVKVILTLELYVMLA